MKNRQTMRTVMFGAKVATRQNTENSDAKNTSPFLRPNLSDTMPANNPPIR